MPILGWGLKTQHILLFVLIYLEHMLICAPSGLRLIAGEFYSCWTGGWFCRRQCPRKCRQQMGTFPNVIAFDPCTGIRLVYMCLHFIIMIFTDNGPVVGNGNGPWAPIKPFTIGISAASQKSPPSIMTGRTDKAWLNFWTCSDVMENTFSTKKWNLLPKYVLILHQKLVKFPLRSSLNIRTPLLKVLEK